MRKVLIKNIGVLLSGNVFALIIPFVAAPIITRLYIPEDFGSFELFAKILAFAVVFASLRYELAMVLPAKENHSFQLAKIALRFSVFVGLVLFVLSLFLKSSIARFFDNKGLEGLLVYLGPAVVLTTVFSILNQSLVRRENFKRISLIKMVSTSSNQAVKVAYGFLSASPLGLLLGQLAGLLLPLFAGLKELKKNLFGFALRPSQEERKRIGEWKEFPTSNMPHGLTDEGEKLVLLGLISAFFGEWSLGLFAFTLRYLRIPLQLFGASIGQALFPRITRLHQEGKTFYPVVIRVAGILLLVSFFGFGSLYLWGESLFAFILGDNWAEAGVYASYMAPWLGLNFVASPISTIPTILKRQNIFFYLSLAITIFSLSGIWWLGNNSWDFYSVLSFLVVVQTLGMLIKLLWILYLAKTQSGK